jgi:pimeloyl-ACP methyl ester carboxylesterase
MPRSRRVIVTLHGINSTGAWQDEVAKVFEPHFRCVSLRYPHFLRLGWLKIFNPWLRRKALKTVAQQFSAEIVVAGVRPHLVAHSFGTWIAAQLIKRPGARFDRVVFAGSPLPAHFDWAKEMKDNPRAFYDLTNEWGLRDGVISLAGKLGKSRAGEIGFKRPPELIHDTGALRDACHLCRSLSPDQFRIHNVRWEEFKHGDWFVGSVHSANLWLPYFWGFPPEEYCEFIEACLRLDEMEGRDALNLRQEEEAFRGRGWSWTRRGREAMRLSEYVESSIAEYLRRHNRQADLDKVEIFRDLAIQSLWVIVSEAIEERRKQAAGRRDDIVLRLHPKIAISAAIAIAADS